MSDRVREEEETDGCGGQGGTCMWLVEGGREGGRVGMCWG